MSLLPVRGKALGDKESDDAAAGTMVVPSTDAGMPSRTVVLGELAIDVADAVVTAPVVVGALVEGAVVPGDTVELVDADVVVGPVVDPALVDDVLFDSEVVVGLVVVVTPGTVVVVTFVGAGTL